MAKYYKKKTYGSYKTSSCPFCGKIATHQNESGLNVCRDHTKQNIEEIKCACGSWLEQRSGKFGPYFNCLNCGNLNYNKAMEMKSLTKPNYEDVLGKDEHEERKELKNRLEKNKEIKIRKEITISSNDVEYFD